MGWRHALCYFVSYDNGISWEYCSDVVRASPHLIRSAPGEQGVGYTYPGVHRLPDGRILVPYWFCAKEQDEPIEDVQIVRQIAILRCKPTMNEP